MNTFIRGIIVPLARTENLFEIFRNEYVNRILDIINNLKKQDAHIQEILKDLRSVQKEMNSLSEKLGRSFKMAEQLITVVCTSTTSTYFAVTFVVSISP